MRRRDLVPFAGRKPDKLLWSLVAVVVLAAIAAGWTGWSWWQAAHDSGLARARTRDAVLHDAREALATLHTLDYRTAQQDIDAWSSVTASDFHSDLVVAGDDKVKELKEAELVSAPEVRDVAVTELNERQHTARVMATVRTEVSRAEHDTQQRHSLLRVRLTRERGEWKISGVQAAT